MTALIADEFAQLMQRFALQDHSALAIAVSGGPDSMALLLLLRKWAASYKAQVTALTVDHGLRENSAAEAGYVAQWCSNLNIPHHILHWQGDKPSSGIMDAARDARYALMAEWCEANHISHLVLAHHADDQAETVLMRFAKGSGVDGLAGMQAASQRGTLTLLRPLLSVPKARLIATCERSGQDYVRDPSNENELYTRPRLRALLPLLEKEGFSSERMADLAERMASARDALDWLTDLALRQCFDGTALDWTILQTYPQEIQARVLRHILSRVGQLERPPRRAQLVALLSDIASGSFSGRTLQNCIVTAKGDKILFCIENSS